MGIDFFIFVRRKRIRVTKTWARSVRRVKKKQRPHHSVSVYALSTIDWCRHRINIIHHTHSHYILILMCHSMEEETVAVQELLESNRIESSSSLPFCKFYRFLSLLSPRTRANVHEWRHSTKGKKKKPTLLDPVEAVVVMAPASSWPSSWDHHRRHVLYNNVTYYFLPLLLPSSLYGNVCVCECVGRRFLPPLPSVVSSIEEGTGTGLIIIIIIIIVTTSSSSSIFHWLFHWLTVIKPIEYSNNN